MQYPTDFWWAAQSVPGGFLAVVRLPWKAEAFHCTENGMRATFTTEADALKHAGAVAANAMVRTMTAHRTQQMIVTANAAFKPKRKKMRT